MITNKETTSTTLDQQVFDLVLTKDKLFHIIQSGLTFDAQMKGFAGYNETWRILSFSFDTLNDTCLLKIHIDEESIH